MWHCKWLPKVTDMRCEEMGGRVGGLAKEKTEREGEPSLVDILQREGDSAREDKTRAMTSYWLDSAPVQQAMQHAGPCRQAERSACSGRMQDRRPLPPESPRLRTQQLPQPRHGVPL